MCVLPAGHHPLLPAEAQLKASKHSQLKSMAPAVAMNLAGATIWSGTRPPWLIF